jgi:hypothetical protein
VFDFLEAILWFFGDIVFEVVLSLGRDLVSAIARWCGQAAGYVWNLSRGALSWIRGRQTRKRGQVVSRRSPVAGSEVLR